MKFMWPIIKLYWLTWPCVSCLDATQISNLLILVNSLIILRFLVKQISLRETALIKLNWRK